MKTIIVFTSEGRIDKDWTTGGSRGRVITLENEEKPEYFDNLDELMEFLKIIMDMQDVISLKYCRKLELIR